jgi:hypothetical protein
MGGGATHSPSLRYGPETFVQPHPRCRPSAPAVNPPAKRCWEILRSVVYHSRIPSHAERPRNPSPFTLRFLPLLELDGTYDLLLIAGDHDDDVESGTNAHTPSHDTSHGGAPEQAQAG